MHAGRCSLLVIISISTIACTAQDSVHDEAVKENTSAADTRKYEGQRQPWLYYLPNPNPPPDFDFKTPRFDFLCQSRPERTFGGHVIGKDKRCTDMQTFQMWCWYLWFGSSSSYRLHDHLRGFRCRENETCYTRRSDTGAIVNDDWYNPDVPTTVGCLAVGVKEFNYLRKQLSLWRTEEKAAKNAQKAAMKFQLSGDTSDAPFSVGVYSGYEGAVNHLIGEHTYKGREQKGSLHTFSEAYNLPQLNASHVFQVRVNFDHKAHRNSLLAFSTLSFM